MCAHVCVLVGSVFVYMHKHLRGLLYRTMGRKGQHPDSHQIGHLFSQRSGPSCHLSLVLIPPFSVLTLQRVWQDPCQLWLSYCTEEKKLKEEQLALLAAAHVDFEVHFQFPLDKQRGNATNQIKN